MKACLLSSGSKGNSCLVMTDEVKILIDVGTTTAYIENELDKLNIKAKDIDAVLITHIHDDHIKGLKTFIKKYNPTIYVTNKLLGLLEEVVGTFKYELYEDKMAYIKDLTINIIKTSHDAGESLGFIIKHNNKSLAYITDTGYINSKYFDLLKNKTVYMIESNHDVKMLREGPYPYFLQQRVIGDKGHLSNKQTSDYLCKFIGKDTNKIVLTHISEKNNTEEKVLETFNETLKENNIKFKNVIISRQNEPTEVIEI